MAIRTIPFVPFPVHKALDYARSLGMVAIGNSVSKTVPNLGLYLYQAESLLDAREYASIAVFTSVFWFSIMAGLMSFIGLVAPVPSNFLPIAFLSCMGMSLVSYFYVIMYPRLLVMKRVKELDKNLLFAMRHLLLQVKSGIPLFDSMVSVSRGQYGMISKEFNDAVRKISTGMRDVEALEEMALKNPSLYFRRTLWQLSNAIRAGSDVGQTLDIIINNLSNEQRIMVRQYGAQLNPLAFMYMMFGVILPSLGIALMVSLSSFTGLGIEPFMFWGIIAFLVIFKFNFLGIVKNKRPAVEVYD
jgi:flagellar protein FlaJ